MFDIQATIKWATAVFENWSTAAVDYKATQPTWQQSFFQLTLPLYVAAYIVAGVLALITGGSLLLGQLSFGVFLFSALWALGWTFVIAFIFDYLAGTFRGIRSFDSAYAVVALAIVPAAAGTMVSPLPWIGWLLSLAGSIYALVLAYRFLPVFLGIPEDARVKHFALSIIIAIVVNVVVSGIIVSTFAPSMMSGAMRGSGTSTSDSVDVGLFGGLGRQADVMEAASQDTWDPPSDGMLTDAQVAAFADSLKKTQALRDRLGKSFEGMEDKEPSVSDVLGGVGDAMRLSTAEMEVVKSAGGNWAEHQWVRGQLEVARIQQDINDAVKHNYDLFLKYQDQIEAYE
ncbi:MAG: Yip1 family protein [Pseudomonadales bacterium]